MICMIYESNYIQENKLVTSSQENISLILKKYFSNEYFH